MSSHSTLALLACALAATHQPDDVRHLIQALQGNPQPVHAIRFVLPGGSS